MAFLTTITIVLTVGVAIYYNEKMHQAAIQQSRSTLRDEFIKQRISFYPQLQELNPLRE